MYIYTFLTYSGHQIFIKYNLFLIKMVKIMIYSSDKLQTYNESVTNVAIRVIKVIKSASTNMWWPRTTTNKTATFTIFVNVINIYTIYLFFI